MGVYYQKSWQRAFGTFPLKGDDLLSAVEAALSVGYRAFDTAQMYGNESSLGEALRNSGVPRDELCVTTKVHPDNFSPERFLPSVERSLGDLGVDAVDVLLLHWPPVGGDIEPSLRLLQEAHNRGLARFIGVSNYTVSMLERATEILDVPIATNQVEFHPLLNQERLLAGASSAGVPLSSYCSVARGEVMRQPLLEEIGRAHGKTAAQVALRWILQKGVSLNTMSTNPGNIRLNFDIMDFSLSSVELSRIGSLSSAGRRIVDSNLVKWAPDWD